MTLTHWGILSGPQCAMWRPQFRKVTPDSSLRVNVEESGRWLVSFSLTHNGRVCHIESRRHSDAIGIIMRCCTTTTESRRERRAVVSRKAERNVSLTDWITRATFRRSYERVNSRVRHSVIAGGIGALECFRTTLRRVLQSNTAQNLEGE